MIRNKFGIFPAAFLISTAIVLSGCSKSPETNVAVKTNNVNQSTAASNNGNMSAGNAVPANGNAAVYPSDAATASGANSQTANGNKDKPVPPANYPKPQIGSGGNDFALFSQVRGALNAEKEFETVIVEIKEGNVVLNGNVSSEAQKIKAGQMVQAVNGIKAVKNNLRVAP